MDVPAPRLSKRQRTQARLLACALELFEAQGYEATTVAQIAAAARVTEMTFFRHFSSKEQVLLEDPYDPLIAAAVSGQPVELGPLARAVGGMRTAWRQLPEPDEETTHRRVRIAAATPALRGAVWRNNAATEGLIAEQLIADGADPLRARAAAAAVLAAVMAALFEWASNDGMNLGDAVLAGLDTLESGHD